MSQVGIPRGGARVCTRRRKRKGSAFRGAGGNRSKAVGNFFAFGFRKRKGYGRKDSEPKRGELFSHCVRNGKSSRRKALGGGTCKKVRHECAVA